MGIRSEKHKREASHKEICFHETREAKRRTAASIKYQEIKKDSEERQLIRDIIIEKAENGIKKIEILVRLDNEFPDSKNSKYFAFYRKRHQPFFSSTIDSRYKKYRYWTTDRRNIRFITKGAVK